jgi:membrane-associated phospholipid phosphatase
MSLVQKIHPCYKNRQFSIFPPMIHFINPKPFYAIPFFIRLAIGLIFAACLSYFFIDFPLLDLISPYRKMIRPFFNVLSMLIFPPFYLIITLLYFLWARFLKKSSKWILPSFEIGVAQAVSVAFVRIFKVIIGRARPESILLSKASGFEWLSSSHHFHSLPSGHTMAAFTLAASLALLFPRKRGVFFSLALLLSLSRVFLLDHFFSDLLFTGAIGIIIAQICHTVLNKITTLPSTTDIASTPK